MDIQPILGEPCLRVDERTIAVSDLHIGLETGLRKDGVRVPEQTSSIIERLGALQVEHDLQKLILIGDIKHDIGLSEGARYRLSLFFRDVSEFYQDIIIIPGNHDGDLAGSIPEEEGVTITSSFGYKLDDVGFLHGHAWPSKDLLNTKVLVMGHNHANIALVDRHGLQSKQPCWIRSTIVKDKVEERWGHAAVEEVILMPPFNPLCMGLAMNTEKGMGPLIRNGLLDMENARVFLLDGTDLGKLSALRPTASLLFEKKHWTG